MVNGFTAEVNRYEKLCGLTVSSPTNDTLRMICLQWMYGKSRISLWNICYKLVYLDKPKELAPEPGANC